MSHPDLARMAEIPLHQHLGLQIVGAEAGASRVELRVGPTNQNANQVLHGGVVFTACDVACYAALVSVLEPDEVGVTHDIHVSVLRPAPAGSLVLFTATLLRKGKRVAFLRAEAHIGDTLIASAQLTKSLLRMQPA